MQARALGDDLTVRYRRSNGDAAWRL